MVMMVVAVMSDGGSGGRDLVDEGGVCDPSVTSYLYCVDMLNVIL